jgi:hypothetical protein
MNLLMRFKSVADRGALAPSMGSFSGRASMPPPLPPTVGKAGGRFHRMVRRKITIEEEMSCTNPLS